MIDSPNTKLPGNWDKIISVNENLWWNTFVDGYLGVLQVINMNMVGFEAIEKTISSIRGEIYRLSCTVKPAHVTTCIKRPPGLCDHLKQSLEVYEIYVLPQLRDHLS